MPLFLLEFVGHVVDQHLIEIVAAQVRIAVGADDAEHAVGHFQHRHVERAAAEVEDDDLLFALLVEAVGQRRRRSAR